MKKGNGEASAGKVGAQLIWAVVEEAWGCQWYRRHRVPCCWILTL